jgi:hypothetical protein
MRWQFTERFAIIHCEIAQITEPALAGDCRYGCPRLGGQQHLACMAETHLLDESHRGVAPAFPEGMEQATRTDIGKLRQEFDRNGLIPMRLDVLLREPDRPRRGTTVLAIQQVTEAVAAGLEEHNDERLFDFSQSSQRKVGLSGLSLADEKLQEPPPIPDERKIGCQKKNETVGLLLPIALC